jgi:agmatine/peptidylarginine deiminase
MTYTNCGPYYPCPQSTTIAGNLVPSIYGNGLSTPIVSARSYLNAVVTNDNVILPVYNTPDTDNEAYNIFRQVFELPGNPTGRIRKVVKVLSQDAINAGGGGMHCITQNEPVGL